LNPFNPAASFSLAPEDDDRQCKSQPVCNGLLQLDLAWSIVLIFQEFLFGQETMADLIIPDGFGDTPAIARGAQQCLWAQKWAFPDRFRYAEFSLPISPIHDSTSAEQNSPGGRFFRQFLKGGRSKSS
jgi:hypothetical protein